MNQTTDPTRPVAVESPAEARSAAESPVVISVIGERISVGKEVVETGRVRISKRVHEHEEEVNIPLQHEEVRVERVPMNQYVDTPPEVRYEGETMIVPVLREVIEKRIILVEELHVTRHRIETQATQTVTLRKEEVQVVRETKVESRESPN